MDKQKGWATSSTNISYGPPPTMLITICIYSTAQNERKHENPKTIQQCKYKQYIHLYKII